MVAKQEAKLDTVWDDRDRYDYFQTTVIAWLVTQKSQDVRPALHDGI